MLMDGMFKTILSMTCAMLLCVISTSCGSKEPTYSKETVVADWAMVWNLYRQADDEQLRAGAKAQVRWLAEQGFTDLDQTENDLYRQAKEGRWTRTNDAASRRLWTAFENQYSQFRKWKDHLEEVNHPDMDGELLKWAVKFIEKDRGAIETVPLVE